jgi:hypothetical protein
MIMKLKYNEETDRYNLKGLEAAHVHLLAALLNYVRLGNEDIFKEAAFDLINALQKYADIDEAEKDVSLKFSVDYDSCVTIEVEYNEDGEPDPQQGLLVYQQS